MSRRKASAGRMAAFREFMAAHDEWIDAERAFREADVAATEAAEILAVAAEEYESTGAQLRAVTGLVPPEQPVLTLDQELPDDDSWPSPPEGDNLKALRVIYEAGGIDYVDRGKLTKLLYGRDVRAFRQRLYSRTRHWKVNGWLVRDDDGDWVVAPGLLDA